VNTAPFPVTVALCGAALAVFGALWLTCWIVSGFRFPVEGYGVWNALAAIGLITTGGAMVARGVRK